MPSKGLFAVCLLLLVSCGSDVGIATTRTTQAGSDQQAEGPLAPEELSPTLIAFSNRLEARIDRAAGDI